MRLIKAKHSFCHSPHCLPFILHFYRASPTIRYPASVLCHFTCKSLAISSAWAGDVAVCNLFRTFFVNGWWKGAKAFVSHNMAPLRAFSIIAAMRNVRASRRRATGNVIHAQWTLTCLWGWCQYSGWWVYEGRKSLRQIFSGFAPGIEAKTECWILRCFSYALSHVCGKASEC